MGLVCAPTAHAQRVSYLAKAMLFKKNITGARSRWDLVINEDGTVTVNNVAADPLPEDMMTKLKEAIAATDLAGMMKTKFTGTMASASGGVDHEYFAQLDHKRYMVADWIHNVDATQPFFKVMADIEKRYKPSWTRLGGRGG